MAGWKCSVAFYHAPLDEDIVVIPPKGLCPVTEELVAMPAAPFAEVVVAPRCFHSKGIDVAMIVRGDDFFAEGRAKLCCK